MEAAAGASLLFVDEITQEDCWTVISSYFEEKGLLRQQLDSFDEFIQNTVQELVDENSTIILQNTLPETDDYSNKRYVISFGQVYVSKPNMVEADGIIDKKMAPNQARLRNLT